MNIERLVRRILGRGRRRHFFVTPSVRTVRKLFDRYPTSMNIFCYGTLFSTADLSQQTIHHHYKKSFSPTTNSVPVGGNNMKNSDHPKQVLKYDLRSMKLMTLWGTVVIAPLFTQWYHWLETRFPPCSIAGPTKSILKKTVIDQFLFTPPLLCLFFSIMAAAEVATWANVKNEITTKLPKVYVADCLFWIPIQAINFWKVPPTWRVLYIGLMTFVWTNVLCFARSYKTNKE